MSREMLIESYCDGEHEDLVPSSHEHVIKIGAAKPVQIDLCDDCDSVVQELADLIAGGEPTEAPPRQTPKRVNVEGESRPCPICGHKSTTETGLRQHFATKHGTDEGGVSLLQWEARELERQGVKS